MTVNQIWIHNHNLNFNLNNQIYPRTPLMLNPNYPNNRHKCFHHLLCRNHRFPLIRSNLIEQWYQSRSLP